MFRYIVLPHLRTLIEIALLLAVIFVLNDFFQSPYLEFLWNTLLITGLSTLAIVKKYANACVLLKDAL